MTDQSAAKLLSLVTQFEFAKLHFEDQRRSLLSQLAEWCSALAVLWRCGTGVWTPERSDPKTTFNLLLPETADFRLREQVATWAPIASMRNLLSQSSLGQKLKVLSSLEYPECGSSLGRSHELEKWASQGVEDWLICVHQVRPDCWAELLMVWDKNSTSGVLDARALVTTALEHIGLLHPLIGTIHADRLGAELPGRHRAVLRLILQGHTRKEIASDLGISTHTVNDYCKNIYSKYQVNSATELAAQFLKLR